jgi:cation:H+ antiporter
VGLVVVGLALLVGGAHLFLEASIQIARSLGVSELVIGLTIVAAGTSLPEVATSVMAAIRGERDIAVGNVVGSNIFNILAVLGLSSAVSSNGVAIADEALRVDIPVMIAVAVACLPIFFTGYVIARWEGALFLAWYVAYTGYVVLAQTDPALSRTSGPRWSPSFFPSPPSRWRSPGGAAWAGALQKPPPGHTVRLMMS